MNAAVMERNKHVDPLIAAVLATAAATPEAIARAEYVSRLLKMDWQFEHAPAEQWRKGRDELRALRELQVDLDPRAELWNKHAPFEYVVHRYIKAVIVEPDGPRVTRWIRTAMGTVDLSAHLMERHAAPGTKIDITSLGDGFKPAEGE